MGEEEFELVDEAFDDDKIAFDVVSERAGAKAAAIQDKEARRRLEERLEQKRLDKMLGDYDFELDLE